MGLVSRDSKETPLQEANNGLINDDPNGAGDDNQDGRHRFREHGNPEEEEVRAILEGGHVLNEAEVREIHKIISASLEQIVSGMHFRDDLYLHDLGIALKAVASPSKTPEQPTLPWSRTG